MADWEIYDRRFRDLVLPTAKLEKLYTGTLWAEGPVWFADGQYLLFSDIPNDRILRWVDGAPLTVFRCPSRFANGNTRDLQGRLLSCEHGSRSVTRTEIDGSVTTIADRHAGARLNSPNDLVVARDGAVWFTDPPYGILSDYEGHKAPSEQEGSYVYRVDPATGLRGGEVFAEVEPGVPDGLRTDTGGNVWTSCGNGVLCFSAEGEKLGRILVPETVANLTFGGPRRNRLFIAAHTSLYSLYVNARGAQEP
jgi:gluconolactonase